MKISWGRPLVLQFRYDAKGSIMPRKSRIDAPGALHHIIVRGIEISEIFRDNLFLTVDQQILGKNFDHISKTI